jgi:hypothetical protein
LNRLPEVSAHSARLGQPELVGGDGLYGVLDRVREGLSLGEFSAVAEGKLEIMPDVQVTGSGTSLDGLAAALMQRTAGGATQAAGRLDDSGARSLRRRSYTSGREARARRRRR